MESLQLKKIEMTNFKSYTGTQVIVLEDRFTSIIGPNGSGKSNILDAISFCLNVKTNNLRVKQLGNLISNGKNETRVRVFINNLVFERSLVLKDENKTNVVSKYFVNGLKMSQSSYNDELHKINIFPEIPNFIIYQGDIIKEDVDLLRIIENVSGSVDFIKEYQELEIQLSEENKKLSLCYEKRKDSLEILKQQKHSEEAEKQFTSLISQKEEIETEIYKKQIYLKKSEISNFKELLEKEESKVSLGGMEKKYQDALENLNKIRSETMKLQKKYFEIESEIACSKSISDNSEEIKQLQDQIEVLKKETSVKLPEISNIVDEVSKLEIVVEEKTKNLEMSLNKLTLENFEKIQQREEIQTKINKAERIILRNKQITTENEAKKQNIKRISNEISQLKGKVEARRNSYEIILQDEKKMNDSLNEVIQKIFITKGRKNDITKQSQLRTTIMNIKSIFSGVYGAVIDLIKPTQERYEIPVGILLGKYDLAVVVKDEQTAYDCVKYLKESKSCRMTFLPLTKITGTSSNNDSGIGILASRCLTYEPQYAGIVNFIFGDSLITNSLNEAKTLVYSKNTRVCTLDGMIFTPTGLITGGSGTISNKFEESVMDELLKKRKALVDDLRVNSDRKESYSDVKLILEKINDLNEQKQDIVLLENEIEDPSIESYKRELQKLNNDLKEYEAMKASVREKIKLIEKEVYSPILGNRSISDFRELVRQHDKQEECRLKLSLLRSQMEQLKTTPQKTTTVNSEDLKDIQYQLEASRTRLRDTSSEFIVLNDLRSKVTHNITRNRIALTKAQDEYDDIVKYALLENPHIMDQVDTILSDNNDIRLQLNKLNETLSHLTAQINSCIPPVYHADNSSKSKFNKLNREYELAKAKVQDVRSRYMEVKKSRMEVFTNCFVQVAREIPEIYRQLYNNYYNKDISVCNNIAYLIYEGDPFVNNLKYYLMPPMKRYTEFSDLSGGERSMAMLCFMFAVSKYKTPPFYIFDEVDSALDQANVQSLGDFILKLQDQFVIISLKHQFYKNSDALVGVYKCPIDCKSMILTFRHNKESI